MVGIRRHLGVLHCFWACSMTPQTRGEHYLVKPNKPTEPIYFGWFGLVLRLDRFGKIFNLVIGLTKLTELLLYFQNYQYFNKYFRLD